MVKKHSSKKNSIKSKKEKNKSFKRKHKKKTKSEKEKYEKKQLKKLDKEIQEVSEEIKKVALNNKKQIIDKINQEKEYTPTISIDLNKKSFSPSLEMINPPQRRLVPLERVLRVEKSSANILENNSSNSEFNPFQYNTRENKNSSESKYTNYAANIPGVQRIDVLEQSRTNREPLVQRKEIGLTPMYNNKNNESEESRIFHQPKKKDVLEFGREKEKIKQIKYNPSEY